MEETRDLDDITRREKLAVLRDVAVYRPPLTVGILALSVLVGVLEGVGLGFVLPIVSIAQGDGASEASGALEAFANVYALLGIPFTLEYVVGGVFAVMAVRYALGVLVAWLTITLGADYRRHLRVTAYEHALEARTAYYDRHGSEETLNAILTQTAYASQVITKVVHALKTALVSLAYALVALYFAPTLMLLTGVVLVVVVFGSKHLFESGYGVGDRLADANEEVQRTLQAGVQGIREVKLFSLHGELEDAFGDATDRQTSALIQRYRDQTALANLNQFFAAATVFALVYLGLTASSLSLPSLGVFLFAMFRLAPRVSSLNGMAYDIDNDLPHVVRTRTFLGGLAANREDWGDETVPVPVESMALRDVHFGYPTGEGPVLNGVSLSVERGEFVAFVGPSGAGKSTVAALLSGLYHPDDGAVLADGTPIQRFAADEWRSRVAVVTQDPHLFNETLRYNLTVGNREATDEAVEAACRAAQVSEFVDTLPDGYETVLGDDGVRLSGGQRQRVAIARALLQDADVLVLDEATSELDGHLESRVHEAIAALDREYAVVAIAHRLSTITDADAIHVMATGRIVESGTHAELLAADGRYAALYATQVDARVHPTLETDD
jgi:subfamily B ATP-binding cassette protein MsbA